MISIYHRIFFSTAVKCYKYKQENFQRELKEALISGSLLIVLPSRRHEFEGMCCCCSPYPENNFHSGEELMSPKQDASPSHHSVIFKLVSGIHFVNG